MKTRSTVLTVALCVVGFALSFAQSPEMGTWKLNEAKSKIPAGVMKNTTVVYAAEGDKVVQRFRRPMEWVAYEAPNAIDVATAMIDAAYAVRGDIKPAGRREASQHVLSRRTERSDSAG